MKQFIKQLVREGLGLPALRIPKQISVSQDEVNAIKNLSADQIKIDDLGGEGNIAHLGVTLPFKTDVTDGIIVDIQILADMVYQIHIHMSDELQNMGLGYKIYKAVINDLGHLYSGKGRRHNKFVTNIWEKLKQDSDFNCIFNDRGDMCMIKNNPNSKELLDFMS